MKEAVKPEEEEEEAYLGQPFHESLVLRPTSNQENLNIIQSLKSSASTGYNGFSVKFLEKNNTFYSWADLLRPVPAQIL